MVLVKCDFSYSYAAADKISTDLRRRRSLCDSGATCRMCERTTGTTELSTPIIDSETHVHSLSDRVNGIVDCQRTALLRPTDTASGCSHIRLSSHPIHYDATHGKRDCENASFFVECLHEVVDVSTSASSRVELRSVSTLSTSIERNADY